VLTAETLRTDLLDLWTQGRMPIKSVLIVTHNIEEAVFMCDRILVLSSNPGRVIAEIKVPFKHPRNRLDPAFRRLVDEIYAKMTARQTDESTKKVRCTLRWTTCSRSLKCCSIWVSRKCARATFC
jgi:NitT/TauT family transport system ATP-binding protein